MDALIPTLVALVDAYLELEEAASEFAKDAIDPLEVAYQRGRAEGLRQAADSLKAVLIDAGDDTFT